MLINLLRPKVWFPIILGLLIAVMLFIIGEPDDIPVYLNNHV
jgi:hypothetical protein